MNTMLARFLNCVFRNSKKPLPTSIGKVIDKKLRARPGYRNEDIYNALEAVINKNMPKYDYLVFIETSDGRRRWISTSEEKYEKATVDMPVTVIYEPDRNNRKIMQPCDFQF